MKSDFVICINNKGYEVSLERWKVYRVMEDEQAAALNHIRVPIGMALAVGFEPRIVIPIALGASTAMCLPISTPPNAIAFAGGRLKTRDFIKGGLLMGLLGPAIAVLWCLWLFR